MEVKTTKTEYRELLKALDQAADFITDKATRAREFDMARRLTMAKALLVKRNGSLQGESGDSH